MRIRKPKERGEWAELCFMAKAAELGFKLSKPWGDSAPYDVAIEHAGHFVRVQVKSTMCKARAREPHHQQGAYMANMRHISVRPYRESDFDFLALYVIPKDVWYVFPSSITANRAALRVVPGDGRNRYERYREAWHLLRDRKDSNSKTARGVTLHAVAEEDRHDVDTFVSPSFVGWSRPSGLHYAHNERAASTAEVGYGNPLPRYHRQRDIFHPIRYLPEDECLSDGSHGAVLRRGVEEL